MHNDKMAVKRKRMSSRRMYGRTAKRVRASGSNIPRIMRQVRDKSLVMVKRTFWYENWVPSTASTSGFWRNYALGLSNLPSVNEFTALFDQYRINSIKFTFRPRYDNFSGNDTTDTTLPNVTNQGQTHLHCIVDPESTVTPSGTYSSSNLNSFLENGSVRSYDGNRAVNVYIRKPMVNLNGVERRVKAPWLQCGQNAIQHYGIHVFAQDINLTGVFGQSWDVFVTYYMQFRGLK